MREDKLLGVPGDARPDDAVQDEVEGDLVGARIRGEINLTQGRAQAADEAKLVTPKEATSVGPLGIVAGFQLAVLNQEVSCALVSQVALPA